MSARSWRVRRPLRVVMAALALGTAACSGGDDDDEARGSTTTSVGSTTETSAGSTTTTADPACPSAEAPPPDDTVPADVDGDGEPDRLGSTSGPGELVLQVELHAGGRALLVLPTFGIDGTGLVGPADVDGDGADELWVRTGSGASAAIVGLVRFTGCQLVPVKFANGDPAELPVGGSVGTSAGISCDTSVDPAADVTTYLAGTLDGETYEVTATEYALDGTALTQLGTSTSTVSASDPELAQYVTFGCDGLAL